LATASSPPTSASRSFSAATRFGGGFWFFVAPVKRVITCPRQPVENQLVVFCDDTLPRWVTEACVLDYSTVATVDKFGNFAVVRYFFVAVFFGLFFFVLIWL
jgi:hypothetical protein